MVQYSNGASTSKQRPKLDFVERKVKIKTASLIVVWSVITWVRRYLHF